MTLTLDEDEVLSAAIAGIPRVAEFIATVPDDDRSRALEAAEKSYLETARTLGYQDADAQEWASAGHVAIANGGEQLQAADAYLSTNIARRYFKLTASPAPSRLKNS